jgi:surface antigen Omp85-like protein
MRRASKSRVVVLALAAVILGLTIAPQRCLAQRSGPTTSAVDGKSTRVTDLAQLPSLPKEDGSSESASFENPGSTATPQSGTSSVASRAKTITRYAPLRETWTTFDLGTKHVKGVFGGLEHGSSIAFGLQLTTADLFPVIEFRATAITSTKLYRRFEGEAYIPKVFSEKTHADLWFDYLRRTKDNFFGIGPNIPNTSTTNYDIERRSYNGALYHDFATRLVAGGYFSVANSATYRGQRTTDIPIDELFSGDPNIVPVSAWAPGLLTNTKILSYGGFALFDLRDNDRGLTKGAYLYGRLGSAQGLKNKTAFSDYGWLETELDARGYLPLGSDKTSLALRGYSQLRRPRGNSQIPFYDLSFLGGRMYGRGFRDYRFRGNNVALFSAELRQTVWTQTEHRGLDVFVFGDGGQVWGDNRSRTDPVILANQDFSSKNWQAGIGGGLQYRYSRALSGRVEIGHSNERNTVYFSVSRGF